MLGSSFVDRRFFSVGDDCTADCICRILLDTVDSTYIVEIK